MIVRRGLGIASLRLADYGIPADAVPAANAPGSGSLAPMAGSIGGCGGTAPVMTGVPEPAQPFYSAATGRYYCGPLSYDASAGINQPPGIVIPPTAQPTLQPTQNPPLLPAGSAFLLFGQSVSQTGMVVGVGLALLLLWAAVAVSR